MKISHIINPVIMNKNSDLFYAQPMTFESMLNAKKCAEKISNVNIELLAACYEEDESIVPDYIKKTSNLTASLLDLMQPIKPRKLPFIKDILDRAVECDSDYIIYTNATQSYIDGSFIIFRAHKRAVLWYAVADTARTAGHANRWVTINSNAKIAFSAEL